MPFSHLKQWTLSSGARPLDGHSPVEGSAQCHSNQQIMSGVLVKGEQHRTEIMPLGKCTEHFPRGNCLEFWSFPGPQRSRRVGRDEEPTRGTEGMDGIPRQAPEALSEGGWWQLRTSNKRGFTAGTELSGGSCCFRRS